MNTYTVLFGVLLYLATVNARHYGERSNSDSASEKDEQNDNIRRAREHGASEVRHKRRSWHMNYGYDYPRPAYPFQLPDNRRDYDQNHHQNQQDLLPQIMRLLDEISVYVRHPMLPPPPPPQPIYVPYPVPYPVPQVCNCDRGTKQKPNITSRFPDMEDPNQNWGFVNQYDDVYDDGSDGSRPISFQPIAPKRPFGRPAPKLDHGSAQAGNGLSTDAPNLIQSSSSLGKLPGMCEVSALTCCNESPEQQRQCFTNAGCAKSYDNGNGCSIDKLRAIIDSYSKAYSPV